MVEKRQVYERRIRELVELSQEDHYSLRSASESDFWVFVGSEPQLRLGSLILIDNGNLRLVWEDELESFFGLEFLGRGLVQFVVLKPACQHEPCSTHAETTEMGEVASLIERFGVRTLVLE